MSGPWDLLWFYKNNMIYIYTSIYYIYIYYIYILYIYYIYIYYIYIIYYYIIYIIYKYRNKYCIYFLHITFQLQSLARIYLSVCLSSLIQSYLISSYLIYLSVYLSIYIYLSIYFIYMSNSLKIIFYIH